MMTNIPHQVAMPKRNNQSKYHRPVGMSVSQVNAVIVINKLNSHPLDGNIYLQEIS